MSLTSAYPKRPTQAAVRPNPRTIIAGGQNRRMGGSSAVAKRKSTVDVWTVAADSDGDRMVIPPLLLATMTTIAGNHCIAVMGVTEPTIFYWVQKTPLHRPFRNVWLLSGAIAYLIQINAGAGDARFAHRERWIRRFLGASSCKSLFHRAQTSSGKPLAGGRLLGKRRNSSPSPHAFWLQPPTAYSPNYAALFLRPAEIRSRWRGAESPAEAQNWMRSPPHGRFACLRRMLAFQVVATEMTRIHAAVRA